MQRFIVEHQKKLFTERERRGATSIFSPLRCARTHFPCRVPASRFIRWFGVSPIQLSLAHSSTSVLVSVNTQSLSSQRLSFLSLGAQLILESTRGYCWRLVFLGLQCSNPLQLNMQIILSLFQRTFRLRPYMEPLFYSTTQTEKEFLQMMSTIAK